MSAFRPIYLRVMPAAPSVVWTWGSKVRKSTSISPLAIWLLVSFVLLEKEVTKGATKVMVMALFLLSPLPKEGDDRCRQQISFQGVYSSRVKIREEDRKSSCTAWLSHPTCKCRFNVCLLAQFVKKEPAPPTRLEGRRLWALPGPLHPPQGRRQDTGTAGPRVPSRLQVPFQPPGAISALQLPRQTQQVAIAARLRCPAGTEGSACRNAPLPAKPAENAASSAHAAAFQVWEHFPHLISLSAPRQKSEVEAVNYGKSHDADSETFTWSHTEVLRPF